MAVNQLVLTGMPAFVGVVRGPTKVGFFIDEDEFDSTKLIEVDLDKNPATVAPASASIVSGRSLLSFMVAESCQCC